MTVPGHEFFQSAWIVADLQQAMRRWQETLKVGPFYVIAHPPLERMKYRGAPAELDISVGLAQAGPLQIELIQQHSPGPSAYRDVFLPGQEGFHHVCSFTQDYDAELAHYAALGCAAATEGAFGDMRYAYVDTRSRLGHMTEIVEDRESIRSIFKIIADAAIGWNGNDPIRYL
jgi:hypothetical protein